MAFIGECKISIVDHGHIMTEDKNTEPFRLCHGNGRGTPTPTRALTTTTIAELWHRTPAPSLPRELPAVPIHHPNTHVPGLPFGSTGFQPGDTQFRIVGVHPPVQRFCISAAQALKSLSCTPSSGTSTPPELACPSGTLIPSWRRPMWPVPSRHWNTRASVLVRGLAGSA